VYDCISSWTHFRLLPDHLHGGSNTVTGNATLAAAIRTVRCRPVYFTSCGGPGQFLTNKRGTIEDGEFLSPRRTRLSPRRTRLRAAMRLVGDCVRRLSSSPTVQRAWRTLCPECYVALILPGVKGETEPLAVTLARKSGPLVSGHPPFGSQSYITLRVRLVIK
jgi:hypothetical protein